MKISLLAASLLSLASVVIAGPIKKYVVINRIMSLNPAWTALQNKQQSNPNSYQAPELAYVTNMDDFVALNEESQNVRNTMVPLTDLTSATIDKMQNGYFSNEVGLSPDDWVDRLGQIFAKYEITEANLLTTKKG